MTKSNEAIDPSPDAPSKTEGGAYVQVIVTSLGVKTSIGTVEQVPSPQLLPKAEADQLIKEGLAEK